MQYMGGKAMIAQELALAVLRHTAGTSRALLLEPFCGAASITSVLAPHFKVVQAADTHQDLVAMLNALREGWLPPTTVTEEEWRALRSAAPSPLRGFVGFGCSFGGRWFQGFARSPGRNTNHAGQAARSLARKLAIGKGWGNVVFACRPYWETPLVPGAVLYCDPPYAGTKRPGAMGAFDSAAFWEWAGVAHSSGCRVLVSEREAPAGWEIIEDFSRPAAQPLRTGDGRVFREALFMRRAA